MRASARTAVVVILCGAGLLGCPGSERNAAADDAQSTIDAVVDTGSAPDAGPGVDTGSDPDAGIDVVIPGEASIDVHDADAGSTSEVFDADADVVDVLDADADVVDVSDVDVPDVDTGTVVDPPDGGIQMTFTFVSAALVSPPESAIQMRAQISWHGALSGSAGGITFHGTIH